MHALMPQVPARLLPMVVGIVFTQPRPDIGRFPRIKNPPITSRTRTSTWTARCSVDPDESGGSDRERHRLLKKDKAEGCEQDAKIRCLEARQVDLVGLPLIAEL
jgi:hypothetical protein